MNDRRLYDEDEQLLNEATDHLKAIAPKWRRLRSNPLTSSKESLDRQELTVLLDHVHQLTLVVGALALLAYRHRALNDLELQDILQYLKRHPWSE